MFGCGRALDRVAQPHDLIVSRIGSKEALTLRGTDSFDPRKKGDHSPVSPFVFSVVANARGAGESSYPNQTDELAVSAAALAAPSSARLTPLPGRTCNSLSFAKLRRKL